MQRSLVLMWLVAVTGCGRETRITPALDGGPPLPPVSCLDADGDGIPGTGSCGTELRVDCNDAEPLTFPGAPEQCNGVDDDCDGEVDEGLTRRGFFTDADGDGAGAARVGEGCGAPPAGAVTVPGDCDDASAAIHPSAAEVCNGTDDDCDGAPDDGLAFRDFFPDADGDGFGNASAAPVSTCVSAIAGRVSNRADCDDRNPTVKPGATELCNRVDDDCDGQTDNGITFQAYYGDVDGDGFGTPSGTPETSCAPVPGKVTNDDDCNDANASVKPGAPEMCNANDDDCDGFADDGLSFSTYFVDGDGDGFGAQGTGVSACAAVAGRVTNSLDCNDGDSTVKPGAPERCNGVDDDCDSMPDDGLTFTTSFLDADGDGFGAGAAVSACAPVAGRVSTSNDCNDGDAMVKPGAPERCNGLDDDCDGSRDEGLAFFDYYVDSDGDGFGASLSTPVNACLPVAGRVTNANDCNDASSAVRPGLAESCNEIDDDCDSLVDEGVPTTSYFPDADGDGRGRQGAPAVVACRAPAGHVTSNDDCNDTSASIRPGATELCNGLDDDCDTMVDDGVMSQQYWLDDDNDGFGRAGSTAQSSCSPMPGWVTNANDCDDTRATVRPTATEACNGIDDNCNASTDEGLTFLTYWVDGDGDGFGARASAGQSSCAPVTGRVTNELDCNDGSNSIRPGAAEVCNVVDDDCDGLTDEGLPTQNWWADADADTFGQATGQAVVSCSTVANRVTNNLDCDDSRATVRPTASETCNGLDDNCSGQTDEGNPGGGAACSTGQQGVCSAGTQQCTSGALSCVRTVDPGAERCNGLDDDCSGGTDEPFALGASCSAGLGACERTGVIECNPAQTGTRCSVTAGTPTASACDGTDNDCDGIVDEPRLTSTVNVSTTAWTDLEVQPYYFSAAGCRGGQATGSDALAGGALVMAGGTGGIAYQRLDTQGIPVGATTTFTSFGYTDVALAQAGDGFVVAGVYGIGPELDLFYVDATTGTTRTLLYSQFNAGAGTIDSLRVVRGSGRHVVVLWRQRGGAANNGIRLARYRIDGDGAGVPFSIVNTNACGSACLVVPSATVLPGVGADSAFEDWTPSQPCSTGLRRVGVSYLPTGQALQFFEVNEDGSAKWAPEETVYTVSSPRLMAEPDVSYLPTLPGRSPWVVAYVTKDPSVVPATADLTYGRRVTPAAAAPYWSWGFAWLDYARENGADSIQRPRVGTTATQLWFVAHRYVVDASGLRRQVMTRLTDQTGSPEPLSSLVEVPVTSGACGTDVDCRPGNKAGLAVWPPFERLYFAGSGATPAGSYASRLTCD